MLKICGARGRSYGCVDLKANFYISPHLQWLVKPGHVQMCFQELEPGESRSLYLVGSSVWEKKKNNRGGMVEQFPNFCSVKQGCLNQSRSWKTTIIFRKCKCNRHQVKKCHMKKHEEKPVNVSTENIFMCSFTAPINKIPIYCWLVACHYKEKQLDSGNWFS